MNTITNSNCSIGRRYSLVRVSDKNEQGEYKFTGFGHQVNHDARCLNACAQSLQEAFEHIWLLDNPDVKKLTGDISVLLHRAKDLAYSAEEAVNQNR